MANRYWSGSLGNDKTAIAETSTTTSGAHVEIRVTYDAAGLNKTEVLKLLEHIEAKIAQDTWPPV